MLRIMKVFCYADVVGGSGGRLYWGATFQGKTRCSSSGQCAREGTLDLSRLSYPSDDRSAMPEKTQKSHALTCVQKTGPSTSFVKPVVPLFCFKCTYVFS